MSRVKLIYRTSKKGYNKIKPEYVNNENCFLNAYKIFGSKVDWLIICDNVDDRDLDIIKNTVSHDNVKTVSIGHGAGTFNVALDEALKLNDVDIAYFLENDYIHRANSYEALVDGFYLGADYISLYDHPDKYMDGINPYVEGGGETTKVFLGNVCHWKLTNSTTMTFAAKVKTLREDEKILRRWTSGNHPDDFKMFIELRESGRSLITPIPGYSTHGETNWLCPIIDWKKEI